MPARKNPVENLKKSNQVEDSWSSAMPRLKSPANIEQTKKTREGEKRSAMVNRAKRNVPVMNVHFVVKPDVRNSYHMYIHYHPGNVKMINMDL